jgi:uncharacterized protein YciI
MSWFAVTREAGPTWEDGGINEQPGVSEHAAYMAALGEDGFVALAGPLSGTENGRLRVLLIVSAETEEEVHRRLADDPWTRTHRLAVASVEPWTIFVGSEQLVTRK